MPGSEKTIADDGQCHVILKMNILVFFKNGSLLWSFSSIIRLSAVLTVVTSMWSGLISFLFNIFDRFSTVIPLRFLVIKMLSLRSYSSSNSG